VKEESKKMRRRGMRKTKRRKWKKEQELKDFSGAFCINE